MRSGYKHYVNSVEAGSCVFVTTTCLDFVHAFASHTARDAMALGLLDDLRYYGATLNAYVVMPHHIHFLALLPSDKDASWLVQRIDDDVPTANRLRQRRL